MTYEIGYRRPPKASRFTKGTSGNPKGRPKGSKNAQAIWDQELNRKVTMTLNGRKRKVTLLHAMILQALNAGMQGDQKSRLALLEFLRKSNQLGQDEVLSLLPDDYEERLAKYVAAQGKRSTGG